MKDLERDLLEEAVRMYGDNKQAAGGALGMSERTLYRRLKTLGLSQNRKSNSKEFLKRFSARDDLPDELNWALSLSTAA